MVAVYYLSVNRYMRNFVEQNCFSVIIYSQCDVFVVAGNRGG